MLSEQDDICTQGFLSFKEEEGQYRLSLCGNWCYDNAATLDALIKALKPEHKGVSIIDCSSLTVLDTAGAILIRRLTIVLSKCGMVMRAGLSPKHEKLLAQVEGQFERVRIQEDEGNLFLDMLAEMGAYTVTVITAFGRLIGFVGFVLNRTVQLLWHPRRLRIAPLVHQIELVGLRALGIVGLISFLIGAVMVSQSAVQLEKFNATIFVVDLVGISQLRELGVLLTAIIIAGRSGSAFTAQIGSMKLREEIDAMHTLGMHHIDVLVIPRFLALLIALPILTFFADIIGLAGGAALAWAQLDIVPTTFIMRLSEAVDLNTFLVGMIKAPFFAAVIAITACYHGLLVEGSSDSVGEHTTLSVVQSIFMVIAMDAFFAIFFTAVDM